MTKRNVLIVLLAIIVLVVVVALVRNRSVVENGFTAIQACSQITNQLSCEEFAPYGCSWFKKCIPYSGGSVARCLKYNDDSTRCFANGCIWREQCIATIM